LFWVFHRYAYLGFASPEAAKTALEKHKKEKIKIKDVELSLDELPLRRARPSGGM